MAKKLFYDLAISSLIFLILFFVSAIIFSQLLLKSEAVTVPDLVGRTLAQARGELSQKDLSLGHRGAEPNDRWDKGLIVRQDPAIRAAERAGAQQYAPELLAEAKALVETARQNVHKGEYRDAREEAEQARAKAMEARSRAEAAAAAGPGSR